MTEKISIWSDGTLFDRLIEFDGRGKEDCMAFVQKCQAKVDELDDEYIEDKAWLLNKIGYFYALNQDFDKSIKFLQDSLTEYETVFRYCDEEMPQTYNVLMNMSAVCYCLELYDDALTFADRAFWAGVNDDSLKIASYDLKNTIKIRVGNFYAAGDDQRTAVEWSKIQYGDDHPVTKRLKLRQTYAALLDEYRYGVKEGLNSSFNTAFNSYMSDYRETSLGWALGCEYLSGILNKQGQFEEALNKANEARAIRERVFGTCHVETRIAYRLIANIYASHKDYDKSFIWLYKSMPSRCEFGGGYSVVQEIASQLYVELKDWTNAIDCLNNARCHWEVIYKKDCRQAITDIERMALIYLKSGQTKSALKCYEYIVKVLNPFVNSDRYRISVFHEKMGDILVDTHNLKKALHHFTCAKEYTNCVSHRVETIEEKITNVKGLIKKESLLFRIKHIWE